MRFLTRYDFREAHRISLLFSLRQISRNFCFGTPACVKEQRAEASERLPHDTP